MRAFVVVGGGGERERERSGRNDRSLAMREKPIHSSIKASLTHQLETKKEAQKE